MIRHIVMFRLTAQDPAERGAQIDEARRRLQALVGVIPGLRTMDVYRDVVGADRNYDFGLVADFDDLAALEAYAPHPAHQEVVAYIATIRTDDVGAFDFEV